MRIKVYYAGDKPCIQEVAIAIAGQAKQNSEPLPPAYMPEGMALSFIGTYSGNGKPDKRAMEFINVMDAKRTEAAALFCTSPKHSGACLDEMRKALEARGVKVLGETLICQGKGGLFGGKMPSDQDMANAKKFADKCLKMVSDHQI